MLLCARSSRRPASPVHPSPPSQRTEPPGLGPSLPICAVSDAHTAPAPSFAPLPGHREVHGQRALTSPGHGLLALPDCPPRRVPSLQDVLSLVHPAGCSILQGAACPGHQRRSSSSLLKTQPISCWPSLAVSFRGLPPSSCFILRDPRDGPSYPRVSRWLDLRGTSQHSGPANPSSAHSQDPAFIERRGPGPPAPLALALLQASPRAPIVSRNHSLPPACPWSKQLPCLSPAMSPTEHIAACSTHTG